MKKCTCHEKFKPQKNKVHLKKEKSAPQRDKSASKTYKSTLQRQKLEEEELI